MKELSRHIETLLLENDCVIVPGLGGFIAHNKPAEFKESANIFCPPLRTIGFNPQLTINDGLLVQAYMQAYDTDFPDASRKIENTVSQIKETLYKNGQAELDNIGTLYYTMAGVYGFEPYYNAFFSPDLYGLGNFSISPLSALSTSERHEDVTDIRIETKSPLNINSAKKDKKLHMAKRVAEHAVGIAAAILLFFILSVPVENTYLDNASYASLGAETMLDAIRSKSVAVSTPVSEKSETAKVQQKRLTGNNVNTLRPVAVKNVKVEKPVANAAKESKVTSVAEKKETKSPEKSNKAVKKDDKGLFIIVSSLQTMADAEKELEKFKKQGYSEASILTSDNRFRIALYRYNDKSQAYGKINELRKEEQFKSAWLLDKSK